MLKRYYVYIPHSVRKSIKRIPLPWQVKIYDALKLLETQPHTGEKMGGVLSNWRKIRVWPYRIMYTIKEQIAFITIVEVEHRGHTSYD